MQILILGASSRIGTALARAFSRGNSLILTGRNEVQLQSASAACIEAGGISVVCVAADLVTGLEPLSAVLKDRKIDLVIDAASACSSRRDTEIGAGDLADLVRVDFLCRTELFEAILKGQPDAPAVIYVSTVLALVRSPDRLVYTVLKQLNGIYLRKLQAVRPSMRLLVVYVGKVITTNSATSEPAALADSVHDAFDQGRSTFFYGIGGRFFLGLFYAQPLVFFGVARLQRSLRRLVKGTQRPA